MGTGDESHQSLVLHDLWNLSALSSLDSLCEIDLAKVNRVQSIYPLR